MLSAVVVPVFAILACGSNPTGPAVATVSREGTLNVPQTWTADLDNGTLGEAGADIWFQAVRPPDERYVTPVGGAAMAVAGMTAPGFNGCAAAQLTSGSVATSALTSGLYLCVRTGEGRFAEVKVVTPPALFVEGGEIPVLTISFVTYERR